MRAGALSDASVGEYVNQHFVSAWKRVGTFTAIRKDGKTVARNGGNVAIYFCTPDLKVVNAIAGPVGKEGLLAAAQWSVAAYRKALEQAKDDPEALVAALRAAHEEEAGKNRRHCRNALIQYAAPAPDVPVPTQPAKLNSDRPSPPGRAVYHCVPVEDLEKALKSECPPIAETKAEVVQAVYRAERPLGTTAPVLVRAGGGRNLHGFLAEKGLPKLDEVYRHVFEGVLGQQVTDQPVRLRELPNGRVYTCDALTVVQRAPVPTADLQDISARLKATLEQIEQLKKQVEELKKGN